MQTGKGGEAIRPSSAGIKVSSGVEKIDLGTQWGIIDKSPAIWSAHSRRILSQRESARSAARRLVRRKVALPNVIANARQTLKTIQSVKSDPISVARNWHDIGAEQRPGTGGI